ncbi:hypothetical protein [Streptomyces sp. NBC_00286]|uniref:hypothetical protein n=1 Tax=Streptomyces sp. NBC_00286 TaxID=2975701 RepID=UPI002E2C8708|nr:hypothetical protein [Streptomyces sp. NBC_00286]
MTDLIRRLAARLGLLPTPRGTHRVRPPHLAPSTAPPQPLEMRLPAHRSPYGLDTPLDATATRPVRPYVIAHEQRSRRRELALATLGLDAPGPYWIHGTEVA